MLELLLIKSGKMFDSCCLNRLALSETHESAYFRLQTNIMHSLAYPKGKTKQRWPIAGN